jgi:biotin transport system substrate-specific component
MFAKETAKNSSIIKLAASAKSSQLFWIISFSILTFAGAQVFIPTQPVPFTLQTMIVLLSGAFLGSKNGALSQVIYLAAGIIGLPVFAGFDLGIARLFGPTGGYLLSFPFAAFLVGYILERNNNLISIILSFVTGQILILLSGSLYLPLFFNGISRMRFLPVLLYFLFGI